MIKRLPGSRFAIASHHDPLRSGSLSPEARPFLPTAVPAGSEERLCEKSDMFSWEQATDPVVKDVRSRAIRRARAGIWGNFGRDVRASGLHLDTRHARPRCGPASRPGGFDNGDILGRNEQFWGFRTPWPNRSCRWIIRRSCRGHYFRTVGKALVARQKLKSGGVKSESAIRFWNMRQSVANGLFPSPKAS